MGVFHFNYYLVITSKDKTKFRSSREWKEFRQSLLEERGCSCELCGTRYSGKRKRYLQVHHLDPENYKDLSPDKFVLLCSSCHEMVERISKKILSKNTELSNKSKWIILLENYLPFKSKDKLLEDINGS